ncbi:MAG: hypothetical protein ABI723_21125 [Bacteroidia bacterium]
MVKSKFQLWVLLILSQSILLLWVLYIVIFSSINYTSKDYLFLFFISIVFIILVFGELRTKAISINIYEDIISSKSFLGFGKKRQFDFKYFDGYKTSILIGSGFYEYLYLMHKDKKVIKISQFYHRNYSELKQIIATKTKNLGDEPFSLLDEFLEVFF